MANGFIVTKDDWDNMTSQQQSWLTYNAVQEMNKRVERLEKRPFFDKCFAGLGGVIGGFAAALGMRILGK